MTREITQTYLRHCEDAESGTALVVVFKDGEHAEMPWSRTKAFEAMRQITEELSRREWKVARETKRPMPALGEKISAALCTCGARRTLQHNVGCPLRE